MESSKSKRVDFSELTKIENNFQILKKYQLDKPFIVNIFQGLKNMRSASIKSEPIGDIFERFLKKKHRKKFGQFYTPVEIVDYIVNFLDVKKNSKILDLSCGCGIFLIKAYERLKNKFGDESLIKNIFGVELNKSAAEMTKVNLWLRTSGKEEFLDKINKNIKIGNSIRQSKFDWESEFKPVFEDGGFDFIVGNPPYVTLKKGKDYNPKESIYSEIIDGVVNSATLMIGKSLELLKDGGVLGFLLPKSLTRVKSYKRLREYLLNNTAILNIFELGQMFKDVRGEQIILLIRKDRNRDRILNNKIKITTFTNKNKKLSEQSSIHIPQKNFFNFDNFLVLNSKKLYDLAMRLIKKYTPLNRFSRSEIFRGIPIGAKSRFIYGREGKNLGKVLRGDSIDKYKIKYTLYADINKIKEKFNAHLNKLLRPKIVLQNIFSSESGIKASYDEEGLVTLDTVTNILVDKIDPEFILALLNSKLINFFIIYVLYNKSVLTMHTDKAYMGKIPIIEPAPRIKREIIDLVNEIIRLKKLNKETKINNLYGEIDDKVYSLYKIKKEERELIENSLKEVMSKKTYW